MYFAPYDWKKCSCFAEQNRETPKRILKPLIDPRDKTLLARDKNIARSSESVPGKYIFLSS